MTLPKTPAEKIRELGAQHGLSGSQIMDRLQDHGLVSDCAVHLADCADSDLEHALKDQRWLL